MVKLETKLKIKKIKIGILGGSFDPAHKGHLAISKEALKRFNLKCIIWTITSQNPLKEKCVNTLRKRIAICKKIIAPNKLIKVKFFEDTIRSNKTADLINHLNKNKKYDLFFLMGADNLINFHKWHKWRQIIKKTNVVVFDRQGYKKKSLNSKVYKSLNENQITFVEFNKVNISSSQLRKI
jgi:nicotinate-nucleotide adenylyltransferase